MPITDKKKKIIFVGAIATLFIVILFSSLVVLILNYSVKQQRLKAALLIARSSIKEKPKNTGCGCGVKK